MIAPTVWTDQGIVDVVAVSRFLGGDDTVQLTEPELRVAYWAALSGKTPCTVNDLEERGKVSTMRLKKEPRPRPRRAGERIVLLPMPAKVDAA